VKLKRISIDNLSPGMILAHNIYTADKRYLLIKKGTLLSNEIIDGLKRRNIYEISVEDGIIPVSQELKIPVPSDITRKKGIPFSYPASLEEQIFFNYKGKVILKIDDPTVQSTRIKAVNAAHSILTQIAKEKKVDITSAELTVNELLNAINKNQNAFLNITGVRMIDEYTFVHSVNVAAYSAIIAREYEIEADELETICSGSLLHDVGKMLINHAILNKPAKLTDAEFSEMKLHPTRGYEILRENDVEDEVAIIAKLHHERCNGSGYPLGITCEALPLSAQIAAIADVYDALTSERVYKKAISSNNAMMIIIAGSGKQFNPELVSLFQRAVGIYPVGSLVRLNNGYIARVVNQNEGIVRPIIQLIFNDKGTRLEDQMILNLMDNNELYIVESYYQQKAA